MIALKKTAIHTDGDHTVHIVGYEQLSSGCLAIHLMCCDGPETHPVAFYHAQEIGGQVVHGIDQRTIMDKLKTDNAPTFVAEHKAMLAVKTFLDGLGKAELAAVSKPTMTLKD